MVENPAISDRKRLQGRFRRPATSTIDRNCLQGRPAPRTTRANTHTTPLAAHLAREPRAFLRAELLGMFSQAQLKTAIAHGDAVRLAPAVYAGARHAHDFRVRCEAALLWSAGRCVLGGSSAAFLHGLTENAPTSVTLVAPRDVHLRPPGWIALIQPSVTLTRTTARGFPTVTIADALIHVWGTSPRDEATARIVDAVRDRRVASADLARRAAEYPRIRDRRAFDRLIADLSRGAESYLEHVAMTQVFNTREFASFARQVPVRAGGRRFVLDMYADDAQLAVELDGRRYHSDDASRRRDLARDTELAGVGITTIRLTFEDILERPEWCRARIRKALAARRRAARERARRAA